MAHNHNQHSGKNILVAFFLNATFSVIELIGGYLTNSVAIYSDALHDFGDSLALLFSYFAEKLSHKEADSKFTFGYRRFSTLAALVNGLILLIGSVFVIYVAIGRIINPEPVKAEGMIYLSILGIAVNSFAAYKLSKEEGANPKMVMYHLLEDLLGWVAVFIVSIVLIFKPWYMLDSILSILISLVILRGVYKNIIKVGLIFLQVFPRDLDLNKIKNEIKKMDFVIDIHEVKGWSIDGEKHYMRFHIKVPKTLTIVDLDVLRDQIKHVLEKKHISSSTIEFESECKYEE